MLTGVTSRSQEIDSLPPVAKRELKRLVTLGARCLLDSAVVEADWSARMVQDSGPLIYRIADLTATSPEGTLSSIRHHAEQIVVLMRAGRRWLPRRGSTTMQKRRPAKSRNTAGSSGTKSTRLTDGKSCATIRQPSSAAKPWHLLSAGWPRSRFSTYYSRTPECCSPTDSARSSA